MPGIRLLPASVRRNSEGRLQQPSAGICWLRDLGRHRNDHRVGVNSLRSSEDLDRSSPGCRSCHRLPGFRPPSSGSDCRTKRCCSSSSWRNPSIANGIKAALTRSPTALPTCRHDARGARTQPDSLRHLARIAAGLPFRFAPGLGICVAFADGRGIDCVLMLGIGPRPGRCWIRIEHWATCQELWPRSSQSCSLGSSLNCASSLRLSVGFCANADYSATSSNDVGLSARR